jgi:hypothetical protein
LLQLDSWYRYDGKMEKGVAVIYQEKGKRNDMFRRA